MNLVEWAKRHRKPKVAKTAAEQYRETTGSSRLPDGQVQILKDVRVGLPVMLDTGEVFRVIEIQRWINGVDRPHTTITLEHIG